MSLTSPHRAKTDVQKVAILFSGGPAPAANAVISTAAASFLNHNVQVVGIKHGYTSLMEYDAEKRPLIEGQDYVNLNPHYLKRSRSAQGILLGTARANPGKGIKSAADFKDEKASAPLQTVYKALCALEVDALISIGGDDTLGTANKLQQYQKTLPRNQKRIRVVHVPKTIDNDYAGIDFTFGYFTAVDVLSGEIRNLLHDAEATNGYFLAETMGRSSGWIAYGAAIAGEASLAISVEDVSGKYLVKGKKKDDRDVMNVDMIVKRIIQTMLAREENGKQFGVIVLAEGLSEKLPDEYLKDIPRDPFGHIAFSKVNLAGIFESLVAEEYKKQTGKAKKLTSIQLGYEARCAKPHAFDIMLGSQLGVGAYRALVEPDEKGKKQDGVMISVSGQLDLHYVPFTKLIDPKTFVTKVRYVDPKSDFHRLARTLETVIDD